MARRGPAAGAVNLRTSRQLLQGLSSALDSMPDAGMCLAAHQAAASACADLLELLSPAFSASTGASLMPTIEAATDLAGRLINGAASTEPGCCSCCLAASASAGDASGRPPVLSFRRVGRSAPDRATTAAISRVLQPLQRMRAVQSLQALDQEDDDAMQPLATAAGLLLDLQYLALALLQARQARAGGARQRSGSSSGSGSGRGGGGGGGSGSGSGVDIPSCADPALFVGDVDAAAFPALLAKSEALLAVRASAVSHVMYMAMWYNDGHDCARCAAEQHLLVLEAATLFRPADLVMTYAATFRVCTRVLGAPGDGEVDLWPWTPDFMARAVPALTAHVLAAAEQVQTAAAPTKSRLACPLLLQASALLQARGGLLQAPEAHSPQATSLEVMRGLLAAAELAMRTTPADQRVHYWRDAVGILLKVSGAPRRACGLA
jgi:hypothetical protein